MDKALVVVKAQMALLAVLPLEAVEVVVGAVTAVTAAAYVIPVTVEMAGRTVEQGVAQGIYLSTVVVPGLREPEVAVQAAQFA